MLRTLLKSHFQVGWYHSHPVFAANPSVVDINNQSNFQALFRDAEAGYVSVPSGHAHTHTAMKKLRIVILGIGRDRNWSLSDGQIQNPSNPFGIVQLSSFVPRGFGFVHHSITKSQTLTSRFATFSSLYTWRVRLCVHSRHGGLGGRWEPFVAFIVGSYDLRLPGPQSKLQAFVVMTEKGKPKPMEVTFAAPTQPLDPDSLSTVRELVASQKEVDKRVNLTELWRPFTRLAVDGSRSGGPDTKLAKLRASLRAYLPATGEKSSHTLCPV
jgi:hypothetical protein